MTNPTRDLRKDPKPGDRFKSGPTTMTIIVTYRDKKKVGYKVVGGGKGPMYLIPLECQSTLALWQRQELEVVYAAD